MPQLEKTIEGEFRRQCKARGWLCPKFKAPSQRGWPDRLVLAWEGRVALVETKRLGETARKLQEKRIEDARKRGTHCYVLTGEDDIERVIAEIARQPPLIPERGRSVDGREFDGAAAG